MTFWERYRKMQADPVVIDRRGDIWSADDWDFEAHCPRDGARPRNR